MSLETLRQLFFSKSVRSKKIDLFLRFTLPFALYSLFFRSRKPIENKGTSPKKVVFLRPGKIGDMIVATPLFHLVKEKYPKAQVTVICSTKNVSVIKNCTHINHKRVVDFSSFSSVLKLIQDLRREPADIFIDCIPGFSRTALIIARLSARRNTRIVGMHKGDFAKFYDTTIDPTGLHIVERNVKLLEASLKCQFNGVITPRLCLNSVHKRDVASFLSVSSFANRSLIGINLSAGARERQWSLERYRKLLQIIAQSDEFNRSAIVLIAVGVHKQWARRLSEEFRAVYETPPWDILTIAALISKLNLLVSPDTSLIHIAAAFNTPVVGLYYTGGENLTRWRARVSKSRECITEDLRGVEVISSEVVAQNIRELLALGKIGT